MSDNTKGGERPNPEDLEADLMQIVRNLAIADARRDYRIATGQIPLEFASATARRGRATPRQRSPKSG